MRLQAILFSTLALVSVGAVFFFMAAGRMPARYVTALFLEASLVTQLVMILLILIGLAVVLLGAIAALGRVASLTTLLLVAGWGAAGLGALAAAFGLMNTLTSMQRVSQRLGHSLKLEVVAPSLAEASAVAAAGFIVAMIAAWAVVAGRRGQAPA